ncbi:MAG TPA: hypothetical protein DDY13_10000 [Cytophagales bacterium]|jgi:hypothetical protein|nr:hypothetical protein [Cytophagales bacterium]
MNKLLLSISLIALWSCTDLSNEDPDPRSGVKFYQGIRDAQFDLQAIEGDTSDSRIIYCLTDKVEFKTLQNTPGLPSSVFAFVTAPSQEESTCDSTVYEQPDDFYYSVQLPIGNYLAVTANTGQNTKLFVYADLIDPVEDITLSVKNLSSAFVNVSIRDSQGNEITSSRFMGAGAFTDFANIGDQLATVIVENSVNNSVIIEETIDVTEPGSYSYFIVDGENDVEGDLKKVY